MHSDDSIIRVQLFAGAAAIVGTRTIELSTAELSSDLCAADASQTGQRSVRLSAIRSKLLSRFPDLAPLADVSRFAVDNEFATDDIEVTTTHTLALIPPVSGG